MTLAQPKRYLTELNYNPSICIDFDLKFLSGLDSLPRLLPKTLKSEVIFHGKCVQIKFKTIN